MTHAETHDLRLLPAGPHGLLVEVGSVAEAAAVYAAARAADLGATDVVPAARTVLFDGVRDRAALEAWLRTVDLSPTVPTVPTTTGEVVELPTAYDGEDLEDVARLWGMTRYEVVATHTGTDLLVAFCGFLPGFAYCTGLPTELAVPRLETPRPRVPAGAVGLAGEFTGVYPRSSPGGWRLIGRTPVTLWDPDLPEPALLSPGTTVRFVEAS
jgi:KipI family sensor histidine kinase inhibitor